MTTALVVADEAARRTLRAALVDGGVQVLDGGGDAQSAFERLLRAPRCDCIVVDGALPAHGARALLEWLVRSHRLSAVPVLLLVDDVVPYRGPRPTAVLKKPFAPDALAAAVRRAGASPLSETA